MNAIAREEESYRDFGGPSTNANLYMHHSRPLLGLLTRKAHCKPDLFVCGEQRRGESSVRLRLRSLHLLLLLLLLVLLLTAASTEESEDLVLGLQPPLQQPLKTFGKVHTAEGLYCSDMPVPLAARR